MVFSAYKNIASVLKEFNLHYQQAHLGKVEGIQVPELLKETISFN
jgi:hypothetical protein